MGLPVEVNNLMLGSLGGYTVGRSLRFRSSASAYITRTPSSTSNRTTWTWSAWIKRGTLGVQQTIYSTNASASPNQQDVFYFNSGDTLQVLDILQGTGFNFNFVTTQVFRDPSAWYHFVVAVDTTQATSTNRVKIYVNGVQITAFSSASYPNQNLTTTTNTASIPMNIGYRLGAGEYFDGYQAEINMIDGQQLTPSSFGAYDTNGVWQPKKYTGTYGTNGFYLPFSDNSSRMALGYSYAGGTHVDIVENDGSNQTVSAGVGACRVSTISTANASLPSASNEYLVVTPSVALPISSSLKIYLDVNYAWANGRNLYINGTQVASGNVTVATVSGMQEWTINIAGHGITSLSSLTTPQNSGGRATFYGISIDGTTVFASANDWTPNNISLTAGTTYDSMIDSPTNAAGASNGIGNYAVLNPLVPPKGSSGSLSNGNLTNTGGGNPANPYLSTILMSSGKFYAEFTIASQNYVALGVLDNTLFPYTGGNVKGSGAVTWDVSGNYFINSTTATATSSGAANDVIMIAVDASTRKVWFGRNGTWNGGGSPSGATGEIGTVSGSDTLAFFVRAESTTAHANFGQRPFSYTPPSGYNALNTYNLPAPSIANGAQYMNAITYTGYGPLVPSGLGILTKRNASTQSVSKSLRFRSSASAYLNRTFSTPTNNKIWTYSFWTKRGLINNSTRLSVLGSNNTGNNSANFEFASETGTSWASGDNFAYGEWTTGWQTRVTTLPVFRDPSAWYHIVIAYDSTQATASNRVKIYVNGSLQTVNSSSLYPTQNVASTMNVNAVSYAIGSAGTTTQPYDGYIAEAVFVDGQQLTPSSFGQTNSDGIWVPKAYTGTYGTNGFYLPFTNTTSTTTLGNDSSGNGNNFTVNNISLTAGTTYDSMIDSPTDYASAGNYALWSRIDKSTSTTLASANLLYGSTSAGAAGNGDSFGVRSTIGVTSGKWYAEFTKAFADTNSQIIGIGTSDIVLGTYNCYLSATTGGNALPAATSIHAGIDQSGNVGVKIGSTTTYTTPGTSFTTNDILGYELDCDNSTLKVYKNGVQVGNTLSWAGTTPSTPLFFFSSQSSTWSYPGWWCNFGQRPFTYAPSSGYNTLNTYNIAAPSKTWFSSANNSGNASATAYPDFVWIKSRSSAQNHSLNDTLRGPTLNLISNATNAEAGASTIFSVNKYGLTLGNDASVNSASATDVMWGWQAGQGTTSTNTSGTITSTVSASPSSGFSIATYTGTGANATVGHGLGVAPDMIIVKQRNSTLAHDWQVYHTSIGATKAVQLNQTSAASTASAVYWNNTAPTSSVFSVGTGGSVNESGKNQLAYCFAAVSGYSAFGKWTGNGSSDGPFVFTNFRPRYVMWKRTDVSGDGWWIVDSSRNTYNVATQLLFAQSSTSETAITTPIDFLSNGFKLRNGADGSINGSGGTYIYMAFAENPFSIARAR